MIANGTYFYNMVSFIVISTVIVLVYIFLSVYMKKMLRRMDDLEKKLDNLKKK